ncbi:MAG: IscS subfamily cysteine desulfurase [Nitrospira sp.]|nr:IscS subfamily cysteine desulfurase [Nitrospira sp.]MCA9464436.1 IscS subfamily cysteine desulfurase [Nitrospira sp.]MCA9474837.1 IscS subfamily cysteine desulfurase [Nitrospira sp.]MCA9479118.1 IscS subfamily cysteine desulfurase [Nitrospira sp.]MDR4489023.1 IscS subfamily cysteine desulfurase [Nitrospirales bacterium]
MKLPIYLDNHSTTPCDPRVVEVMLPYFTEKYGNSASRNHSFGWEAEEGVEHARKQIAQLIHADPKEIIFTSGATESDNLALKGIVEMYREKGDHIITSSTEHRAVIDTAKFLEKKGISVTFLPVDKLGRVNPDDVRNAITEKTILISVMLANNEIGTINPVSEIGKVAKEKGIIFHCDATQGVGKIPVNVQEMGIDLMSFSAHKIYGPKGIGALYVRRKGPRVRLEPMIHGGGHERGMRSGTLAVPLIVGFGKACELCEQEMPIESVRMAKMRDRLQEGIMGAMEEVYLNGHPTERLPGNLNISFAYVEGEALLMGVKEIALSSGSACTSATLEPSYVLRALGVGSDLAHSSIRFGLGRFNTDEEIEYTIDRMIKAVNHLREMSPLYEMAKEGIDLKSVQWAAH